LLSIDREFHELFGVEVISNEADCFLVHPTLLKDANSRAAIEETGNPRLWAFEKHREVIEMIS
jgi:hypothetical protein